MSGINEWIANETLARSTYGEIGAWDVSRVTNMNLLFNDRFEFNSDISGWDVSSVTSMRGERSPAIACACACAVCATVPRAPHVLHGVCVR